MFTELSFAALTFFSPLSSADAHIDDHGVSFYNSDARMKKPVFSWADSDNKFWQIHLSSSYMQVVPSADFYSGIKAGNGTNINAKIMLQNPMTKTSWIIFGYSYQNTKLAYESISGMVKVKHAAFEFGAGQSLGRSGSYFYALLGLASLDHQGVAPPESYYINDYKAYKEGSTENIRAKLGIRWGLVRHIGIDFSGGFDANRYRRKDALGMSQTKVAGMLYYYGVGLFFYY